MNTDVISVQLPPSLNALSTLSQAHPLALTVAN